MSEAGRDLRGWDARLNIRTAGRDDSREDAHHFPYEPTPYEVLERLAESGWIGREDRVLDYGCGKGRVGLFLAAEAGCRCLGIDFDAGMIRAARENAAACAAGDRVSFAEANAETFPVPEDVTCCFFFNPFSETILRAALRRIEDSWYREPRQVRLLFYYPSDEYVSLLMRDDCLMFEDELDCADLFPGDPRERVLCFVLPGQ